MKRSGCPDICLQWLGLCVHFCYAFFFLYAKHGLILPPNLPRELSSTFALHPNNIQFQRWMSAHKVYPQGVKQNEHTHPITLSRMTIFQGGYRPLGAAIIFSHLSLSMPANARAHAP